jgi:ABC-type multidrug transport system fused ATPase/permease subunit
MKHSIFFTVDASILCLILFVACILMVIIGKRVRNKFLKKDEQESKGGVNSLLGALFGLWGFILAFTFSNVSTRFENVRAMMVDEASLIRNVTLRIETFPDSLRGEFREDLKKYLQARIDYYEDAEELEKFTKAKQDAEEIGKRLWRQTVNASYVPGFSFAANNMLAALTAMYDVGTKRDATLMAGIPTPISYMLFLIALAISFVGGFTSPDLRIKEWVVITGFILLACLIILVTLDMARPMRGFIKPDAGQEKIIQLKEMF